MVSRADVNRLTVAQRQIVDMALSDIRELIGWIDLSSPEQARDVFLDVMPGLVQEYGDLAATAAAEWYEDLHPGLFQATTVAPIAAEAVEGSVRYNAVHLFSGDPSEFGKVIEGSVQRFIKYSGRQTVARNVQVDPAKPRYGRVPQGSKTCAWCLMLASRGFVYRTPESAGIIEDDYHNDCNCEVTPSWEANEAHIKGYDPDSLFEMYQNARTLDGGQLTDPKDIASRLRELYPDSVTDGHVH